jgi:hypothetical protein
MVGRTDMMYVLTVNSPVVVIGHPGPSQEEVLRLLHLVGGEPVPMTNGKERYAVARDKGEEISFTWT